MLWSFCSSDHTLSSTLWNMMLVITLGFNLSFMTLAILCVLWTNPDWPCASSNTSIESFLPREQYTTAAGGVVKGINSCHSGETSMMMPHWYPVIVCVSSCWIHVRTFCLLIMSIVYSSSDLFPRLGNYPPPPRHTDTHAHSADRSSSTANWVGLLLRCW